MLEKENALRFDMYEKGACRNKLYVYLCLGCKDEIRVRSNKLEEHSGFCFDCTVASRRLRPYESRYNTMVARGLEDEYKKTSISYEDFLIFVEIKECHYCDKLVEWSEFKSNDKDKT